MGTRGWIAIAICVAFLPLIPLEPATAAADAASNGAATRPRIPHSPIEHVVIVFQENHSFDNVLGVLCVRTQRCDVATTGLLPNGKSIRLRRSPDIIPQVSHDAISQGVAIDQGKMDGFANIHGCSKSGPIPRDCYTQFGPSQIPNLATLAGQFVVSDRTFEPGPVPSWGAHVHLAAATLDGFAGETDASTYTSQTGPGSGCDSYKDALWTDPASGELLYVPACIPDQNGFGPYRASPVSWVPTIMDRLGDAGLSWRI